MRRGRPLRRGKPLGRGKGGLKRGKGLRADPEKVRAFEQRGRESGAKALRESAIAAAREGRPEEGPLDPATWGKAVRALSGNRSILGGARVTDADLPHHVIPKQRLRKLGLFGKVWDPRNGVAVTLSEHANHEAGAARIPREALPERCLEFARECGQWAVAYIENGRIYPPAGSSRTASRGG